MVESRLALPTYRLSPNGSRQTGACAGRPSIARSQSRKYLIWYNRFFMSAARSPSAQDLVLRVMPRPPRDPRRSRQGATRPDHSADRLRSGARHIPNRGIARQPSQRRSSADGSVQALDAARAKTDGAASPRTDGATTPRRSSFWGFGK